MAQNRDYDALEQWFASQPATKTHIDTTFEAIEQIIGEVLPDSARKYPTWWQDKSPNTRHLHARWLKAGWEVDSLDLGGEKVSFKRA